MPVYRYRTIDEMPPPWRDPDDPGNLRVVAEMLALYRRFVPASPATKLGVRAFRTLEELNADRGDPYRMARRP